MWKGLDTVNLAHIIDAHPADRAALVSRSRVTTYGTLREQVARVRGGLAAVGVGQGDRVALLCSNGRYFVDVYLAALGLGAVVVPLNPTSPSPEIVREIAAAAPSVVVFDPSVASAWARVDRASVPSVRHVVITEQPVGAAASAAADSTFDDLLHAEPRAAIDVDASHLAVLMFTSGTAGAPRAAMLTHGNLLSNIEQSQSTGADVTGDDVVYGVLPLHHIFGLNVMLGLSLTRGATVVLVQRFDPSTALDTIRERGVTVIPGAPALWLAFSHFDDAPADSFASVRLALTGAAKMSEDAMRRLLDRFGLVL